MTFLLGLIVGLLVGIVIGAIAMVLLGSVPEYRA